MHALAEYNFIQNMHITSSIHLCSYIYSKNLTKQSCPAEFRNCLNPRRDVKQSFC